VKIFLNFEKTAKDEERGKKKKKMKEEGYACIIVSVIPIDIVNFLKINKNKI
jgi:hypothetical protein